MSRAYSDDSSDDYDQWQSIMYAANVRRALQGKKGRRNLQILLDALNEMEAALVYEFPEWMPFTRPRLIADDLVSGGDVCAVGAFMRKKLSPEEFVQVAGEWNKAKPEGDWYEDGYEQRELTARFATRAGLQGVLAEYISAENDEAQGYSSWRTGYNPETPEQRFERIRRWVRIGLGT